MFPRVRAVASVCLTAKGAAQVSVCTHVPNSAVSHGGLGDTWAGRAAGSAPLCHAVTWGEMCCQPPCAVTRESAVTLGVSQLAHVSHLPSLHLRARPLWRPVPQHQAGWGKEL